MAGLFHKCNGNIGFDIGDHFQNAKPLPGFFADLSVEFSTWYHASAWCEEKYLKEAYGYDK